MLSHFSTAKRDLSYDGSATLPENLNKGRRDKSIWLHRRDCWPEVNQWHGGVITSPILLGSIFAWSQKNSQKMRKVWGILSFPGATMNHTHKNVGCENEMI